VRRILGRREGEVCALAARGLRRPDTLGRLSKRALLAGQGVQAAHVPRLLAPLAPGRAMRLPTHRDAGASGCGGELAASFAHFYDLVCSSNAVLLCSMKIAVGVGVKRQVSAGESGTMPSCPAWGGHRDHPLLPSYSPLHPIELLSLPSSRRHACLVKNSAASGGSQASLRQKLCPCRLGLVPGPPGSSRTFLSHGNAR